MKCTQIYLILIAATLNGILRANPQTDESTNSGQLQYDSSILSQKTEIQFLSGRDKDDAVPWKFKCTSGANSGFWTNLPVPSQWDVKGFGTLNYHRDLTNASDEHGLYEHEFILPKDWAGKRIFLVFNGVMTDTDAKLNGQSVGPIHQGSFYQFKYEVTSLVKLGATNKLEVNVAKRSTNQSVNKAERTGDYWMYAGIFRPVYLEAVPQEFIERVAIDAQADGRFSADVFLNDATNADEVEAQIQTLDGKSFGKSFRAKLPAPAQSQTLRLKSQITAPQLWTAETPHLYCAVFYLKQNGETLHQFTQRFGFRTFEVRKSDGLYLNGQRVILKGADRHSFWPDSGRTLSEAVHRLDIATMKDANMNAVRMSHYPPDAQFLDLCDELGLYVLDELAGWHNFYDNAVGPKLVKEMVVHDVNHPSILFWDNGNEGGFNTNLDHIFSEFDPQHRHVLHPWAAFDGMNNAHYLEYDEAKLAALGAPIYHDSDRAFAATNKANLIYMPTEFLHGLYDGGAGAGLDDYWRIMTESKLLGGGFIWALLDEGIRRPDTGEIDVAGNQAPDGIVGPYRQREASFYTIKEVWSPIQITRNEKDGFTLENNFSFTDANECEFEYELRKFSSPKEGGSQQVIASGKVPAPKIAPGQSGAFNFSMPSTKDADALALRVNDPAGHELWTWVWTLNKNSAQRITQVPTANHTITSETEERIEVKAGELTASFSKQNGLLASIRRGNQRFSLANGPRLATGKAILREIHFNNDGPDTVVSAKFEGDLKSILWRVKGNGWIQCSYSYLTHGTNEFLGVLFDYPENLVTHKRWSGDGPFRVWKNRLRGVTPGVWENDYNNTLTGYSDWIYPEFKGFFANWHWMQLDTKEGQMTVINMGEQPYLQVLTPDFGSAKMRAKAYAVVPNCGLGFLDAIPGMGSKFKEAKLSGPQGQPTVLDAELSGSVSFYFGKLP